MWRYWKLGTLQPQAELQGPGRRLPSDMQYAGPLVSGICPGAHEQTPSYGSNSTTALWIGKAKGVNPERKNWSEAPQADL